MSANITDPLLALVRERGMIDDLQLDEVMQENTKSGKPIGQILIEHNIMDLSTQLNLIAEHIGTEVVKGVKDMPMRRRTMRGNTARNASPTALVKAKFASQLSGPSHSRWS